MGFRDYLDGGVSVELLDSGFFGIKVKSARWLCATSHRKLQPGIILDFEAQGQVVGIEILKLSLRTEPEKPPVADREGNVE